jgi:hypothetical protein
VDPATRIRRAHTFDEIAEFAEMRRLIHARPGGRIRKHNLTILHLAQKKPI